MIDYFEFDMELNLAMYLDSRYKLGLKKIKYSILLNFKNCQKIILEEFDGIKLYSIYLNIKSGQKLGSYPYLSYRIKSGQKIILDECDGEKIKYRDEHSAPFSWKTRSQQVSSFSMT